MAYKRVLTIQDISCVGQCSLTVALPILSACGCEACPLPSAVLSTHTGGFTGYTFRDLTDDIPAIVAHWRKEGILFDAVYSGYLGSTRQIDYVRDIMRTMGRPGCVTVADPAMADNGKLYPGFDDKYVEAMRGLCAQAQIILPNITEACLLTGTDFLTEYGETYIENLLARLRALCPGTVVLTGVSLAFGRTGVAVCGPDGTEYYKHRLITRGCHGTGDIYASAFVGALMRGLTIYDAAALAADFTVECIENTLPDEHHLYGAKFETALPGLIRRLGAAAPEV